MLNYTLFFLARITKLVDEPNDLSSFFFNMIAVVGVAVLLYHLVQSIHIFIMEMQCVSDSRY
jgi:succinate dehydrogenase/fumarate reductase cytochrome b subunit